MSLTFPRQLDRVRDGVLAQEPTLQKVAGWFADALAGGGVVHVYANGHSRVTVEELCVRMGALTGFHPLLSGALATFTDVIGADGLRMCQSVEKVEGLGARLLSEYEFGADEPLVVVSATGQTQAAVDIALAFNRQFPDNPLVAIASQEQARQATPKHSSGKTLHHVIQQVRRGAFLDNCMPMGDVSTEVEAAGGAYRICPLSSIGALTIVQSLNELTLRELARRGVRHLVLQNMHLGQTEVNYDAWLTDQRRRYARTLVHPNPLRPANPA